MEIQNIPQPTKGSGSSEVDGYLGCPTGLCCLTKGASLTRFKGIGKR